MPYQVCSRCVTDNSDPGVTFDENGVCSFCTRYFDVRALSGYRPGESEKELAQTVAIMKEKSRDLPYDCILGISGGVDSAYMLYLATKLGLRVLAVHVDSGWNSEMAVRNIERMCQKLNVQLHTYVMDWPTMKELQRAYMLSGVANLDVPQDHLFCSAVFRMARKYKVKFILNGSNIATEGASAPFTRQHSYRDTWHLNSIYRKHGRGKSLKKYPRLSLWEAWMGLPGVTKINLLNYVPYSKKEAIDLLSREFGWEYYGGKHFESRFTKYFQSVYLPKKFGYDKRRAHLSCLVLNGEMTREEALAELAQPPYPIQQQQEDEAYILKKLDIDPQEWQRILNAPPTPDDAYFSQQKLFNLAQRVFGQKGLDRIKHRQYSATRG
ncbi:MAG: N-acetyl sugar amidotransferase [Clostridiales bacterium]|nr:N-acetyl sugar amidotransferase [Clostridiales bacterium]MDO4350822.1 N-acetyl sugar amidotransferase [Eubacteriales bacterium]MDY4007676.1 N-acetyl sugar amidotransferase [Candidatus Limiplasma sp.]